MGTRNAISLAVLLTCTATAVPMARAQKRSEPLPAERSSGCLVTTAAEAFIPPAPYKSEAPAGSIFVGTPKLWTLLWLGEEFRRNTQKMVWWSPGNDQRPHGSPGLTVVFMRLDATAPLLMTDHSNWGHIPGQPPFITTGLNVAPGPGCWQVIGRVGSTEVKYIVWIGR